MAAGDRTRLLPRHVPRWVESKEAMDDEDDVNDDDDDDGDDDDDDDDDDGDDDCFCVQ